MWKRWAAGLGLTMLLLWSGLAAARGRSQGEIPCEAEVSAGYVALTFDDGPSGAVTEGLLEGLRARGVPVTFFLCGYRMETDPRLVSRMVEDGHEIGIHSYRHQWMDRMSREEIRTDLEDCIQLVRECAGVTPTLFRPPGGLTSPALLEVCRDLGLPVILWSVDPEDWNRERADQVAPYLLAHTGAGDVVLLHDLTRNSVEAAFTLIDRLQQQGYTFCTVSQLAEAAGVSLEPGACYRRMP